MRIIIATVVIVIALFAASCSSKQSFYSEVPYRSMQGKIVQVTETTYPATKSGKSIMLDKKSTQSFTYTYNNEGQLLTSAYTGEEENKSLYLGLQYVDKFFKEHPKEKKTLEEWNK